MNLTTNRRVLVLIPSVIIGVLTVVGVVSASTTIGTDISTGGTLTVTGHAALGPGTNIDPNSTLTVEETYTATDSDGYNAVKYNVYANPSGDSAASFIAASYGGNVTPGNTHHIDYINGAQFYTDSEGTNTVDSVQAMFAQNFVLTGQTATEVDGLQIGSTYGGGTIPTNIGLVISDQTAGTNNYAIKTGLGKVVFGDKTGIGTTTPATQLQISSGANATTTVTIGELGLTTSKGCVNMNRSNGQPGSFYLNNAGVLVSEPNYCR